MLDMEREDYPTDLTSEQWDILQPLIPPEKPGVRPGKTNIREVINAKILMLRSGYVHSVQRLLREPPCRLEKEGVLKCSEKV
jgi:hypothetical protein